MSGPSDPYDQDDAADLYDWLAEEFDDDEFEEEEEEAAAAGGGGGGGGAAVTPDRMRVTAQVEWAGVIDRARGGVRTVNLDGLDLTKTRDAVTEARKSAHRAESAGSSFRAKGWEAQLKVLIEDKRGQGATDRAGLSPTRETLIKWLTGERSPNPPNERRIAAAYADIRDQVASAARTRAEHDTQAVADTLSRALSERYGAEIRLRNISSLELG